MRKITRNFGIKVVAFLITGVLVLNAETDRMVEVECDVPVSYVNLPDSLVRMGTAAEKVRVRAIFNRKFWQSRPEYLVANVDMSDARRGTQRFSITPEMVRVPPDRKARVLEVLDPRRVPLTFEKKVRRRVPVLPLFDGVPQEGCVVYGEPQVEPDRVVLIGPESVLEAIEEVYATPVPLTGATEDVRRLQRVDLSAYDQVQSDPLEVEVFFDVERIEDRILQKRPFRTAPTYRIDVEPDSLDLVVRGPTADLEQIRESRVRLYVDVSSLPEGKHTFLAEVTEENGVRLFPRQVPAGPAVADTLADKEREEPVAPEMLGSVQNLPELVVLVGVSPNLFTISREGK